MATLQNIQARIAKLQAQAEAVVAKQSSGVLGKIRDLMHKHSLTTADIEAFVANKPGRKAGTKVVKEANSVAAKYVDPKTGATWSGRGRAPLWIAKAKDRTKFEVAGSSADVAASKVKAAPKAGNYVRGPQPAMYRDPKSGATWSGRGRAPAWIASAKDRTKFLIEQASESSNSNESKATKASVKGAAAKKAVVKKVVAKKAVTKKAAVKAADESKSKADAPAAQKVVAKKATAKKAPAKKTVAKKAATRKVAAKKVAAKSAEGSAPAVVAESEAVAAPSAEA
ncbi:H-NS family nucleoid-associated regulatory protein [Paraburkholderia tropica]|uniref:H-NS family nucleoid-associated regulatory protein n=1 Tax=Paraburkholderia tropica TaxID=92647 RepID=UPI0015919D43|nr:H-NS family nucleoid-associated regulatory protein [Paraburkholderia tropica]